MLREGPRFPCRCRRGNWAKAESIRDPPEPQPRRGRKTGEGGAVGEVRGRPWNAGGVVVGGKRRLKGPQPPTRRAAAEDESWPATSAGSAIPEGGAVLTLETRVRGFRNWVRGGERTPNRPARRTGPRQDEGRTGPPGSCALLERAAELAARNPPKTPRAGPLPTTPPLQQPRPLVAPPKRRAVGTRQPAEEQKLPPAAVRGPGRAGDTRCSPRPGPSSLRAPRYGSRPPAVDHPQQTQRLQHLLLSTTTMIRNRAGTDPARTRREPPISATSGQNSGGRGGCGRAKFAPWAPGDQRPPPCRSVEAAALLDGSARPTTSREKSGRGPTRAGSKTYLPGRGWRMRRAGPIKPHANEIRGRPQRSKHREAGPK